MRRLVIGPALVLAVAGLLAPADARADCLPGLCLCGGTSVGVATVLQDDGDTFRVRIDDVTGADNLTAGEELELQSFGDVPGARVLVLRAGSATVRTTWLPIDEGDRVRISCPGFDEVRLPLVDATTIAPATDCQQQLLERGIEEPPCCDTGCCCTHATVGWLALLPLALRRRSRKRSGSRG